MVVCVRVNNTFYSIICTFASILKLLDLFFPCFPSVTRRSDIDECSSGSHDCHENATWVNTAGHYDCICKAGFTGNGRNCSGKVISFFTFVQRQPGEPPPPPSPPSTSHESLMTRTRGGAYVPPPPPTQYPGSTVVEGSQMLTWRWGTPHKWGNLLW